MMLIADYHLQFTFGYQIRFRAVSSGIKNVQKYRVVLGSLKRARAGLRVENHDPVPTLIVRAEIFCSQINKKLFLMRCFYFCIAYNYELRFRCKFQLLNVVRFEL